MATGHREQTDFATCRCGKEYPVRVRPDASEEERVLWLRLANNSLCDACCADHNKAMDMCPETLTIEGGVAGCGGGWHHDGRCFPIVTDEQIREVARRAGW